jgi:hypothetical protein
MRLHALTVAAALALTFAACTKNNPNYCADAGPLHNCAAADAAAHDRPETMEFGEVGDTNLGDATGDASDGPAEAKPVCSTDNECSPDGGAPACDTSDGGAKCVECTMDKHCGGTKPICDTVARKCVECTGMDANDCKGNAKAICNMSTQSCVECLVNATCGATTPICDMTSKSCRMCRADAECKGIGPGVCVDWDGHCATATEVITLQSGAACVAAPASFSFCLSADAANALTMTPPRSVLLVKGPDPVAAIDVPSGVMSPKVLLVGQAGAKIGAGSGDVAGVHVKGATMFWVRDLAISGGTVGVVAEMSAELHLTRCAITMNDRGGLRTTNAGFDITNTIVAANGPGSDLGGVTFGGVRLGAVPTGGLSNFANNTVVDNMLIGVSCATPYDTSTSIIFDNVGANTANCNNASCCGPTNPDPMLDPTYHLKAGSPCIDKIPATMSTVTVDIDQQARPTPPNGKLDCGADEFVP